MSTMDKYLELKKVRDEFQKCTWSCKARDIVMFIKHSRTSQTDYDLSDRTEIIDQAMNACEHAGTADITCFGDYELGKALQKITLRYLNRKLKTLAEKAKQEAESCLKELQENNDN